MTEALDEIKDLLASTRSGITSLEQAVIAKTKVENAIRFIKDYTVKSKVSQSNDAFLAALSDTLDKAPSIYAEEVETAVSISTEYAHPAFITPLLEVGEDPDLYLITENGTGWNKTISVELDMDNVAGSIDDYAEAVEGARATLHVNEGRTPEEASTYWRDKVYRDRDGKYAKTVNLRMQIAASKAPFWSLLNYGSKNVSMSSDIGGSPYPSRGGRRFVTHIEDKIKKHFISKFRSLKTTGSTDANILATMIQEAQATLIELDSLITKMSEDSNLISSIAREIGVRTDRLNASRILEAAAKVKRGEHLSAQINVGAGYDQRLRSKKFTDMVNRFSD